MHYLMHIPKTAGLTLQGLVRRRYKKSGELQLLYTEEYLKMGVAKSPRLKMAMGHFRFGLHPKVELQPKYITFLRQPIEHVISHYHYTFDFPEKFENKGQLAHNIIEFAQKDYGYNLQTRFISGIDQIKGKEAEAVQRAKENLLRYFEHIGISEYFDLSLLMLKEYLRWPIAYYVRENDGKTRHKNQVNPQEKEQLAKILKPDQELYDFALMLFYNEVSKRPELEHKLKRFIRINQWFQKLNPHYIRLKRVLGLLSE